MSIHDLELEEGVISPVLVLWADSRKLLVGRHERRGDIVSKKQALSDDMLELDDISVSHDSASTRLGDVPGRDDLPMVVGVVVRVTRDLLALRADPSVIVSQRVLVYVRVQELLRIFVLDRDGVEVSNLCKRQLISPKKKLADTPCEFSSISLPCSVSWKAGDMKVSPGPE